MFDNESKELSLTCRSLSILEKLPSSKRRDSLISNINVWLNHSEQEWKNLSIYKEEIGRQSLMIKELEHRLGDVSEKYSLLQSQHGKR